MGVNATVSIFPWSAAGRLDERPPAAEVQRKVINSMRKLWSSRTGTGATTAPSAQVGFVPTRS
jgi:hypothetical protein